MIHLQLRKLAASSQLIEQLSVHMFETDFGNVVRVDLSERYIVD